MKESVYGCFSPGHSVDMLFVSVSGANPFLIQKVIAMS